MNILVPVEYSPTLLVPPATQNTDQKILSLIQSISAEKIMDLSRALLDLIVVNLGDNAAERYSKQALNYSNEVDIKSINSWDQDYLPCSGDSHFQDFLKEKLSRILSDAFSTPQAFVDNGLTIVLSNDEPLGPLLETLNDTKMPRYRNDVPKNYHITLSLIQDTHGTGEDLFFELSQKINGFEFYLVYFKLQM